MTVFGGDIIYASDINRRAGTTTATSDASATSGTTELAIDQVTINAVSGHTYRIVWWCPWLGSVAADRFFLILRTGSGIAGTQLTFSTIVVASTSATEGETVITEWTAGSTASQTFTGTFRRSSGTGTLTAKGSGTQARLLTVDDVS
ncbi:hypothetical protein [Actinoplanes lobatus]|uniref:Uncharacterized protein n=1 Tax=Actinoplanes lobatus TaxID=113568 RepID=A0A7W7HRC2_9ACTN|nr:hypothetical protein [Actinoplanes lobatus]MBB4755293.1 hypothetical protein [Actinoplanes lobatus]GIE46211.1 hypothetical protein Alo02nite_91090 [Actinoplanes lobatus]